MGVERTPASDSGTDPITLSTGETVELPLSTEATMAGAVFAAPKPRVTDMLPDGIRPIRATPGGDAAVALLSVEYHRIGDGEIDPYDEFAVILPTVPDSTAVPYLSAVTRGASGYTWCLPVSTAPAKALGVDIWGFPKILADITHEDDDSRRRTTVTVDGERFVTFEAARPPSIRARLDGCAYTDGGGESLRVPKEVDARVGAWPFSDRVAVSVGEHRRAEPLRGLDVGPRALARISVDGETVFYPSEPAVFGA